MKERRPNEEIAYQNKLENARHNLQLLSGWRGRTFYEKGQSKESIKKISELPSNIDGIGHERFKRRW